MSTNSVVFCHVLTHREEYACCYHYHYEDSSPSDTKLVCLENGSWVWAKTSKHFFDDCKARNIVMVYLRLTGDAGSELSLLMAEATVAHCGALLLPG